MSNDKSDLNAIIGPAVIRIEDENESIAMLRTLKKEFSSYITMMPNISNNIILNINEEGSLDRLTDIIANILPLNYENKNGLIYELSSIQRAKELLRLISNEI